VFVIVQVFWSPATIVPVQSADKVTVKPATTAPVSVTLNAPGPNVTRVPFTLAANVGGVGLLYFKIFSDIKLKIWVKEQTISIAQTDKGD